MDPTTTDARSGASAAPGALPRARGRGRRPTAEVRREILLAAGELLLGSGMAAFTIEEVARRSGASKMTIYKFWPSRGALALEGYFATVEQELRFPDTGDVRADLRAQLHAFVHLLIDTPAGRVVSELVGTAQTDPQLRSAYVALYSSPRRDLAVERIAAAQRAGQVREEVDPRVLVDQLWGACYHRLLVPDLPIDVAFADKLLEHLFTGILARGGAG